MCKSNLVRNVIIGLMILNPIVGSGFSLNKESKENQMKPNVLIIFSDQHNKKVMGFEGHPDVMVKSLLSGKPMKRNYFVSESWSQATVITKNQKLGIMIDPTVLHKNWDFRDFGDMFFDVKKDPIEVDNKISDKKYEKEISKLRGYYDEFIQNTLATRKEEMIKHKEN